MHAVLGHHNAALSQFGDDSSFEVGIVKASVLISMGRGEEATKVLDST